MHPPIYAVCAADAGVKALLSDANGVRFYPFGQARSQAVYPYAVWQLTGGQPENYLGDRPDVDSYSTQVDVYAKNWASAREVAAALQAVIESVAYVTAYYGESVDPETKSSRVSFLAEWVTPRT